MSKNVKFDKCPAGYRNPSIKDFKELMAYTNAVTNNNGAFSLCKNGMTYGYGFENGSGTSISWSAVDLFGFGADCSTRSYGAGIYEDIFSVATFKCYDVFFDLFVGNIDDVMYVPYEDVEDTRCILIQ